MEIDFEQIPLVRYLKKTNAKYYGDAIGIRKPIAEWLSYIPATFPHYTSHSLQHSERIILQISQLLFRNQASKKPISVSLSAVESYILIASAYLHDSGMVVSDEEKTALLKSEDWKQWTSDTGPGGGGKKYQEIEEFRLGNALPDKATRNFLADRELQILMAEYFRREHHSRAAQVVLQHGMDFGGLRIGNANLLQTIADVCAAHGLRHHELEDPVRYPDERDIEGETVNVRFMAILLRLGDLLDMDSNRACPLLMSAACPVSADSLPHWEQYHQITHRRTSPEYIEIRAECKTPEQHRLLQDWCQWLVDETKHAHLLMARSRRHAGWKPPLAEFRTGSIDIRPVKGATYVPRKWTFQLDQSLILERLIHDTYGDKITFIRELLQNALDATRCQVYADLSEEDLDTPEYPTQVDETRRQRYPVRISLRRESREQSELQILRIEDYGIGMDEDIIERYLLQVGRSFYTTDEFRRAFRFSPTSRFGIGFLSVFAVSKEVRLETYKPSSPTKGRPIKLTLKGPQNYLLVEEGTRKKSGTSIEVELKGQSQLNPGQLTERVRDWCRRVEFPIEVDDLGVKTTVRAERPQDFIPEMPDATDAGGAKFMIKVFPVDRSGLEGELYVLARVDTAGEDWRHPPDDHDSELDVWRPRRAKIETPSKLYCLHGISLNSSLGTRRPGREPTTSVRVDFRGPYKDLPLSRVAGWTEIEESEDLTSRWQEVLHEHLETTPLARSPEGWKYKQYLLQENWGEFRNRNLWDSVEGMVHIYENSQSKYVSFKYLKSHKTITSISFPPTTFERGTGTALPPLDNSLPTLIEPDIKYLSFDHADTLFWERRICNVRHLETGHLAIDWEIDSAPPNSYERVFEFPEFVLSQWSGIGFSIFQVPKSCYMLNTSHPFVQWRKRVANAFASEQNRLGKQHLGDLLRYLDKFVRQAIVSDGADLADLVKAIDSFPSQSSLPPELRPPALTLTREMFCIWPQIEEK
jgi:molecular chaperone HtpG